MVENCETELGDIEDLGQLPEVSRLATLKKNGPVSKVKRINTANDKIVADSIIPG